MTGMNPDSMAIGKVTWDNIQQNTEILNRLRYVTVPTQGVVEEAIANILGLKNIFVGNNVYNSANEGATISVSDIWSDDYASIFLQCDPSERVTPGLGRTVSWEMDAPGMVAEGAEMVDIPATVEQYREEQTRSDIFRVRQNTDELIFDKYFAHLLKVDA